MADKTTVQITKDNIDELNIKVGTILKDNEGLYWKITDFNNITAGMRVCDKDGNEIKNFVGNAERTIFGGGLSDLLNDGVTTYYIESENPEIETQEEKNIIRVFTVCNSVFSAVDRADFLASLDNYENGKKKGKDTYKIKETLNRENIKPVRFVYEGHGYLDPSIYESFVCKNNDNSGYRYLMIPHNPEYYKGFDKLILSEKTFNDIEECQKALIDTFVNLKDNHNFKIENEPFHFYNIPEKFKQPLLSYIADNEKEICQKAEEWLVSHPDFKRHENIKDNIALYLIQEDKAVNFNSPEWIKKFEMIELSMDNPLLANAILEKENKENKTMSKEQKCIAKWIDKDGNTINFERFSTNNIKRIENDCIELNADTLIASKDTLSNFDYFKVFETEPDGTNEKLMLTIPAHLYLESVANFYKKKHEHFPYEDEFDAARWKNITDKREEKMGITELTPEKYMELYNNSINKKERVSMDLDSAKAVLDSCANEFGLKLKDNNIISINGTYPSMQEIVPSEILRASIMGREQKASINLEARVSVIWDSLGITGNGKEYIFNKYLEKLNELYRTDNKLEKFGFNTINSTDKIQQVKDLTTWALEKHPEVFMTRGKEGADKYNASYPDTLIDIFTMGDYLKDKESELNLNKKNVKYSYFVKDTAEFEQFADFEPIPDLNAKEAVGTMFEQIRKGLSAGIGIHIPNDFIFNDPYGEGAIIFSKVNENYSFYMGDNFVKELKKNDEHARNVINAFKELDEAIRGFHLNQGLYKEPDFLYIKEKELFGDNTEEFKVTKEEIQQERAEIGKKIQHLKDILNNPDPNNPDDTIFVSETKENIERLEKLSEEEIKSLILWKKQNQKNNEDLHKEFVEEMKRERKEQYTVKEGNLFSDNELKTVYKVTNKDTGRSVTIQPSGNIEENIKNLGRLKNLTEAQNVIERIKSMGFNIYSTRVRVILFNDDKFYDFDKYADSGKWNYRTENFEFNTDRRNLKDWDFKNFIDGGLKITKEMKEFEKMETVKEIKISPVTLEEILNVMEMKPEVTSDGKIKIFDEQRQEYIDNRSMLPKFDEDNWTFKNAEEIFERLDIYINDYFINDMVEQLTEAGAAPANSESLEELCLSYKRELEKGNDKLESGELNLAWGIVNPETVIMPDGFKVEKNIENKSSVNNKLSNNIDWTNYTEDVFNKTKADLQNWKDVNVYASINVGQLSFELVPQNYSDRMGIYTRIYYPDLNATYGEDADGVRYDTADGFDIDSETFIKMTYKEFKDYFENTVLPSSLDESLTEKALQPTEDWNTIWEKLNKEAKTNYVLEKLSKAGIEVVTDKEEFDRILESQAILQKMTDDLSKLKKLTGQLNEERLKSQILEKTKEKQEKSIRWNNYKDFVNFIEEAKEYIPVEKNFDTNRNYSSEYYKIKNRIPIEFSSKEATVWLVNAEISKNVVTPVIIERSYTGVRFLSDFENVKQYFDDSHVFQNFQTNIKSILQKNISLEQEKQTRFIDELEKQTNEIKKIEKREAYQTVSNWIYEAEEKAEYLWNKEKEDVKEFFKDNDERKFIGIIPSECMQLFEGIEDYHLYADKSYLIHHYINRHPDVRLYDNIQNVLDNYTNVYYDNEQNSIGFVKVYGNLADCLFVKNDNGKIVLFGSTYNQPEFRLHSSRYKKITPAKEQEQDMSLEGSTPLSQNPVGNTAAAISDVNDKSNISQSSNKSTVLDDGSLFVTQMKTEEIKANVYVKTPNDIVPYLKDFANSEVENVGIVMLDGSNKVKEIRSVTVGTVNRSLVHSREVFKEAIRKNAAAVIVFHNHPSGNTEPSNEDVHATDSLMKAANIIGIPILDHIIVSEYNYFSFMEHGLLSNKTQNMTLSDGITYGFAHNGKIYLNPDVMNSETAVHEYTHLWDAYIQRTNPELWNKGLEVFKNTSLWNDVINDENYSDIKNNENLVLSECHARLCGKIADEVLQKVLERDGELKKADMINWDNETWEYIGAEFRVAAIKVLEAETKEFSFNNTKEFLEQFLSTPMKDLFQKELNMKLEKTYEQKYPSYIKNRFVLEQNHPDGWAVGKNMWVVWDNLLNQRGRSGGFFDTEKGIEAGNKELNEIIDSVNKSETEALEKEYEGNGVYTCQLFSDYSGYGSTTTRHDMLFVSAKNNKSGIGIDVAGVRDSDCGTIRSYVKDYAKRNNILSDGLIISFNPVDKRKEANKLWTDFSMLAKETDTSFVYQDGDKESRYAFAIDYAQKHNLPCFLIDNEISRKVANDVDFVVFCKDYEDIITKVKSLTEKQTVSEITNNKTEFTWELTEKDNDTLKGIKNWTDFYEKSFSDIELNVTDKNNEKHSYIIQVGSGTSSEELEFIIWDKATKLKRDNQDLNIKQRMQLHCLGYSYIKTSDVPNDSLEIFENFCKEHISGLLDETGGFIDASLENSKLVEFNGKPKVLEDVTASELLNGITIKTEVPSENQNDKKQANSIELTSDDLKKAKALLPKEQYQLVLSYTQGEESEHFKGIIKEISSKAETIKGKREILTEEEKHPLAFKYTLGNSRFYFSEWDGEDELFGYVVLNGDTQNSEWGYTSLEELKNAGGRDGTGFPVLPEMTFYGLEDTIEKQVSVDYPELSEQMGFSKKKNHNEQLVSEFGKEILEALDSRKLEPNAYNICCAAQFVLRSMDSSERKEVISIMEKCGCQGKHGKENTEDFLTDVVNSERKTASAVYTRNNLYERINKACSTKKLEANKGIQNPESDYDMEI